VLTLPFASLLSVICFSLPSYNKKKEDYAIDLQQFKDLIQQMDQHVATLSQKKKERTNELAETSTRLDRANTRVEELKQAVISQDLSVEDVQKMQAEQKGVDEAIQRAADLKEKLRKSSWGTNTTLEKAWNELESAISEYSTLLSELDLLPLVSAKAIDMKIKVNKAAALENSQSKLLGVDLVSRVNPAILESKQEYSGKSSDAKWKYQEALDKLNASEEALSEATEKLKIMQDKQARCEETLEGERDAQEAKLAVRLREAEAMKTKVASLRDPVALEEQMASYERQCAELEALRMSYQEENVARKKAVCDEIEMACQAIKDYEAHCLQKAAELQQYVLDKKSNYGTVKLPSNMTV
jgi:SMC interacting uncharacterized protein involved in chromosome segregation